MFKLINNNTYLLLNFIYFMTTTWIIIGAIAGILLVWKFLAIRRGIIKRKIQKVNLSKEEERELWILANVCWERAKEEGVRLPEKNLVVCRLESDPYTWIIVKLGIKDKELFRTRMSLQDVANARLEVEKSKEEDD